MDYDQINLSLHTHGLCCICGKFTAFFAKESEWGTVRETMHCGSCLGSSRKRHVVTTILDLFAPNTKALCEAKPVLSELSIYSALSNDPLHLYLGGNNPNFTCSEYFPVVDEGHEKGGVICQNLERLTFREEQFHLVITEDVFEHIRKPEKAFREVYRVLKLGGYHIFTIPFRFDYKTVTRVNTDSDDDVYILPPAYHVDKLSKEILVYTDFGYDMFDALGSIGFYTEVSFSLHRDAMRFGIADSYVFISRKSR